MFFETHSAREFHESDSQQQEALAILRHRKLTKLSFERDWKKDGSRLAPAIDILRNGWGFRIDGKGTSKNPYWMLEPNQSPSLVRTTEEIKSKYYASDHWEGISKQRYEHDEHRCVLCVDSCRGKIVCHHTKYRLFGEKLDELMTVCEHHHVVVHEDSRLKFPTGVELWIAERLLNVVAYPFEEWLLP